MGKIVSPIQDIEVLTPNTCNVTIFGNRVLADNKDKVIRVT
jgi:hypothetical protein